LERRRKTALKDNNNFTGTSNTTLVLRSCKLFDMGAKHLPLRSCVARQHTPKHGSSTRAAANMDLLGSHTTSNCKCRHGLML
jgi:hypothetical protein